MGEKASRSNPCLFRGFPCSFLQKSQGKEDQGPASLLEFQAGLCEALRLRGKFRGSKGSRMGHTPSTAGTFRKKFRKSSGKTPETLSERFLEFPSRVRLGCPKPYNSRHLRRPERFQNSLPPSTAGDVSFFRIGSGEGLSELVTEFPAVLGVFLIETHPRL